MEEWIKYIKPELLVLVPVLIFFGKMLKDSFKLAPTLIPAVIGGISIVISAVWVLGTSLPLASVNEVLIAAFTSIVQGALCAGAAVYGNQLFKQYIERRDEKQENSEIKK